MFEVGREYTITTIEAHEGEESPGFSLYKVVDWSFPLLKVEGAGIQTIFNVTSPKFVKAELWKARQL